MEANDTLRSQLEVASKELRLLQETSLTDRECRSRLEQQVVDYRSQLSEMQHRLSKCIQGLYSTTL